MVSITFFLTTLLAAAGVTSAKPVAKSTKQPVVTYLGTQGSILSSGAWTSKGIVYTSGTVPTFNGSIITGGIEDGANSAGKGVENAGQGKKSW